MKKIERILVYSIASAFFVLALFLDLPITQGLFFHDNPFSKIVECSAELPAYWLGVVACVLGFRFGPSFRKKGWTLFLKAVFLLGAIGVSVYGGTHFRSLLCRNAALSMPRWGSILTVIGMGGLLFVLAYLVTLPIRKEAVAGKALRVALLIGFYFVISLLAMQGLKMLWLRPRYRTLVGLYGIEEAGNHWKSVFQATGFWNFQKLYGVDALGSSLVDQAKDYLHIGSWSMEEFYSFPSGHTMNALATLCLSELVTLYPNLERKSIWFRLFAYLFAAMTALSRILCGAHNLSDVSFGFLFGCLNYDLCKTFLYGKVFQKIPDALFRAQPVSE